MGKETGITQELLCGVWCRDQTTGLKNAIHGKEGLREGVDDHF